MVAAPRKSPARRRRSSSGAPKPVARIMKRWQWVFTIATAVAALGGAIVVMPKVWDIIEPWWIASHAYVQENVSPVKQQADVLLYWRMIDKKDDAKKDEGGWTLQLEKETDPARRQLIQKQIEHAKQEQFKVDQRVQTIKVPDWAK